MDGMGQALSRFACWARCVVPPRSHFFVFFATATGGAVGSSTGPLRLPAARCPPGLLADAAPQSCSTPPKLVPPAPHPTPLLQPQLFLPVVFLAPCSIRVPALHSSSTRRPLAHFVLAVIANIECRASLFDTRHCHKASENSLRPEPHVPLAAQTPQNPKPRDAVALKPHLSRRLHPSSLAISFALHPAAPLRLLPAPQVEVPASLPVPDIASPPARHCRTTARRLRPPRSTIRSAGSSSPRLSLDLGHRCMRREA